MRQSVLLGVLMFSSVTTWVRADMREPLNTALLPSTQIPKALQDVGVDQKLGASLPGELQFRDELGREVKLSQFLGKKPTILTLAYFRCPGLCTLVLTGMVNALHDLSEKMGRDYQVLTVSISPQEKPPLALAKKRSYLARYDRIPMDDDSSAWRMLTGDSSSISRLADAVGFRFKYEARYDEYSHPSVLMVLTPDGRISQYLFGIHFTADEIGAALRRASLKGADKSIGSRVKAAILFCFHYDPLQGRFSFRIMYFLRAAAVLTAICLFALLLRAFYRERLA